MNPKDGKYQVKIKNGDQYWRDVNGNIIYYKDSYGFEYWRDYDANGNCIHFRNSRGYKSWYDYDANGNCIHAKYSNGCEYWYDSNGKRITKKEFDAIHNPSCEGTVVEVMGKKYKLTAA